MITIPKELGQELVQVLFGRKIQLKDRGHKFTGRVVKSYYSDGLLHIQLDNNDKIFILNGESWMKVIK